MAIELDWKKTLATVAPSLASALGGPLAGTAVTTLSRILLGEESSESTAKLEAVIAAATPETLAQLKVAELEFEQKLAELDVDLERIAAGDRDSARNREVEVKDRIPGVMGFTILFGFFAAFMAMLFVPPPEGSKDALFILLGVLGGMATAVTSYFYGTSSGSALKSKLMARKTD